MDTERIKEIQSKTAYPDSISVQQALFQVWNECAQEKLNSERLSGVLKVSDPTSKELRKLVDEWKKANKRLLPEEGIHFEFMGGVIKDSNEKEKSSSEEFDLVDYAFENAKRSIDRAHRAVMIDFACEAFDINHRSDDSFRAVAEELYDKIYDSESKEV